MQEKLLDLAAAACEAGVRDLDTLPLTSITKGAPRSAVLVLRANLLACPGRPWPATPACTVLPPEETGAAYLND